MRVILLCAILIRLLLAYAVVGSHDLRPRGARVTGIPECTKREHPRGVHLTQVALCMTETSPSGCAVIRRLPPILAPHGRERRRFRLNGISVPNRLRLCPFHSVAGSGAQSGSQSHPKQIPGARAANIDSVVPAFLCFRLSSPSSRVVPATMALFRAGIYVQVIKRSKGLIHISGYLSRPCGFRSSASPIKRSR